MRVERSQNVSFKAKTVGKTNLLRESREFLEQHLGDDIVLNVSKQRTGNGANVAVAQIVGSRQTEFGKLSFDLQTLINKPAEVLKNIKNAMNKTNKK